MVVTKVKSDQTNPRNENPNTESIKMKRKRRIIEMEAMEEEGRTLVRRY